jgi:cell division septation protein DedD
MDVKWKNRLVGSLVLFALGITFIPFFLSPSKDFSTDNVLVSPDHTRVEEYSIATNSETASLDVPSVEYSHSLTAEESFSPKIELFALQIGSYDEHENAKKQVTILKKAGFPAFIRIEGSTRRVLVGPQTGIAHVQEVRSKLRASLNYRSIVVTYDPKEGAQP